jgi:hypothetical protein
VCRHLSVDVTRDLERYIEIDPLEVDSQPNAPLPNIEAHVTQVADVSRGARGLRDLTSRPIPGETRFKSKGSAFADETL